MCLSRVQSGFMPGLAALSAACVAMTTLSPDARAGEMYLSIGGGASLEDAWSWQSVTWTPFSTANGSGPIARASLRSEAKTYVTDIPARDDVRIWVAGLGVDAEAGWQLANEWGSVAVLGGIAWRDYMLTPDDPNSALRTNMLNPRVTVQGHLAASPQWGSFFYAEYVAGVDEWFAEAKPYWQLDNGLKLGPEFSLSGGSDYLHARAGVSVIGWEFDLPWVGKFWAGGSAGALWDTDGTRVEPYGALHITRAINGF
jgi:hypothetical protein